MGTQSAHNPLALGVVEFQAKFVQREVHHVMVMNFCRRQIAADFQPDAVQQVNFFRREMW